jgi:predicted metalloprotease
VQSYYTNLVACLNKAWEPKVRAARGNVHPAPGGVLAGRVQSPCASGFSAAFYCGADRALYLRYDDAIKIWNRSTDRSDRAFVRLWATDTAGHVFGHHVQQLTGIIAAAHRLEYDAPVLEARLELSRRLELQAFCLGAAFIGANKPSYGIPALDVTMYLRYVAAQTGEENDSGGPRDHGSPASQQYWATRGFNTHDSASCNTFTAPTGKVS